MLHIERTDWEAACVCTCKGQKEIDGAKSNVLFFDCLPFSLHKSSLDSPQCINI